MSERDIFIAAIQLDDVAARGEYLRTACAEDDALRERVKGLLSEYDRGSAFPESPVVRPVATVDHPGIREAPGTVIGPYKLLEQIGEGGFGVVFMAEQTHPMRRKVALKVLKPGMDTRQVVARFEAERQALALMDHPNIAKVFDGGATPSGRPYFVMELVKGVPVTDFCDQNHLTPRQRLELFVSVCSAVQHAHQKGIIHRDIKPSNVLVTMHDTTPVVKVIDFGVAKALGQELTDKTLFTAFAQMVGTPLYMSPEQAGQSGLDIDTRSDIYSLGVLLYELLTGTTPFDKERFRKAAYDEIRRIIREEEPPRPSTRLSELGRSGDSTRTGATDSPSSLASVSASRHTEPAKLTKLFRGEVDWIVMKALEKDRNRRYETANAFAADVQRYLADEAVQACPPSVGYRLRKFVRRNRVAIITVLTLFAAVLTAVGGIGYAVRDREAVAKQAAHDRAARLDKLEGSIDQALEQAQAEYERDNVPEALAQIQRIDALLAGDTDVSDQIRQRVDQWRSELTILQRLEDIALLPNDGEQWLQIDAAYVLAFRDIGIDIDALPAEEAGRRIRTHITWKRLTEALDEWAFVRHDIAYAHLRPAEAARPKEHLFQIARAADADELRSQARLSAEKWDLSAAERLAGLPEVGRLPAALLRHLAMVIYYGTTEGNTQAARDRAVRLVLSVLISRPGDVNLSRTCANWYVRMRPPNWAEAAHYWSIAVALRPENPYLRARLGYALAQQGRLDDAIGQLQEAIRLKPDSSMVQNSFGIVLKRKGKLDDAIAAYRKAIELDPKNVAARNNLGIAFMDQGKLDDAIASFRKVIELDPSHTAAHHKLGSILQAKGEVDLALTHYRKAAEKLEPPTNKAMPYVDLAGGYESQGKWDEAVASYKQAIELDPKNVSFHSVLGKLLQSQGKWDEAITCYRRAVEVAPKLAGTHNTLAWALVTCADPKLRDPAAALRHAETAVELAPKSWFFWQTLAWARYRAGDWKGAVAAMTKAKELGSPGNSHEWFLLAMAHWKLGDKCEARAWYDKSVAWMEKYHPTNEELRLFRAEAAELLGLAVEVAPAPREKK